MTFQRLAILIAVGLTAGNSWAGPTTFRFTGTVVSNDLASGPFTGVAAGEAAELLVSFDEASAPTLTVPPPPSEAVVALYDGAVCGLTLTLGGAAPVNVEPADAATFRLGVQNAGFDSLELNNAAVPATAGFRLQTLLQDSTGLAFDSVALPPTLDLAAFDSLFWRVFESNPAVFNELAVSLDAFELVVDEPPVEGDANGDGQVDFSDLILVVLNFGCSAPDPCEGDVDGDGDVDFDDVTMVLSNLCSGVECDDGDPCTIDSCFFGFCIHFFDPACAF